MYYAYKQKACVAVCVTKIYIREPNEWHNVTHFIYFFIIQ